MRIEAEQTARFTPVILALACLAAGAARAQAPDAQYAAGKTVTLVVSSSAGGGYDLLARTLARFLPKHLGGATVVVQNLGGAGGIVATKYLYAVAPKDGLTIGLLQNNTPFEPLLGTPSADYDATKFNWLGSPSVEAGLLVLRAGAAATNLAEAKTHEVTVAADGVNSTPSFYARLMNETLGLKLKIIVGFAGMNGGFLAMERGEVDGYPSTFYSSLMAIRPTWIADRTVNVILQYGAVKQPELPDVPFMSDLVTKPEDQALLTPAFAQLALGRPFVMPPGVPGPRVAAMRAAMSATFKDPDFVAEAGKLHIPVNAPRSGEEALAEVRKAYSAPADVVARLRRIAQP